MHEVVTMGKALSDENRVRILAILEGRDLGVCQVIELLGLAPSTISKPLTGNSCRSQMVEGWARQLKGAVSDACSASTHPKALNPLAVQVMAEADVNISIQQAKSLDAVQHLPFDYVVTACREAHETCPVFAGRARIVHRGVDDPPRLAATTKSREEALRHFAWVRDGIKAFIEQLPEALLTEKGDPE